MGTTAIIFSVSAFPLRLYPIVSPALIFFNWMITVSECAYIPELPLFSLIDPDTVQPDTEPHHVHLGTGETADTGRIQDMP